MSYKTLNPEPAPAARSAPNASRRGWLRPEHGLIAGLGLFSLGGYLLASRLTLRLGFPLDDAWIHQTYARNLALLGQWAFIPNQPSAGSTAPLWSALLAIGHRLGLGPYLWTYLLGWACLCGLALTGMRLYRAWRPYDRSAAPWVGVFLVFEWRLVWAAGSGMETLLFAWLIAWTLADLLEGRRRWLRLGLLIGASLWVRPDGLTLLGPALLALWASERDGKARLQALARLALGAFVTILPYLLFNQLLAGSWWPNTFFAKQAEYAILRQKPLWERIVSLYSLPLVGAGVLLLPGLGRLALIAARKRDLKTAAVLAWLLGYLALYALRLPVTYQHGRYVIPAMPIYFVAGLAGLSGWLAPGSTLPARRILSRTMLAALALVGGAFWLVGARAYADDVAVIETEMVTTAHWVAENTPPQALVAAHDIGALGYFGQRRLLDLAGLISPEVIPFIRDEDRLAAYLDRRRAEYLVTFPGWYPRLAQHGRQLFVTQALYSPNMGGENMAVYAWPAP